MASTRARTTFDDGSAARTHAYDTGAAWMSLALQGSRMGLVVHGMGGFDYDAARDRLGVPAGYEVQAMAMRRLADHDEGVAVVGGGGAKKA